MILGQPQDTRQEEGINIILNNIQQSFKYSGERKSHQSYLTPTRMKGDSRMSGEDTGQEEGQTMTDQVSNNISHSGRNFPQPPA